MGNVCTSQGDLISSKGNSSSPLTAHSAASQHQQSDHRHSSSRAANPLKSLYRDEIQRQSRSQLDRQHHLTDGESVEVVVVRHTSFQRAPDSTGVTSDVKTTTDHTKQQQQQQQQQRLHATLVCDEHNIDNRTPKNQQPHLNPGTTLFPARRISTQGESYDAFASDTMAQHNHMNYNHRHHPNMDRRDDAVIQRDSATALHSDGGRRSPDVELVVHLHHAYDDDGSTAATSDSEAARDQTRLPVGRAATGIPPSSRPTKLVFPFPALDVEYRKSSAACGDGGAGEGSKNRRADDDAADYTSPLVALARQYTSTSSSTKSKSDILRSGIREQNNLQQRQKQNASSAVLFAANSKHQHQQNMTVPETLPTASYRASEDAASPLLMTPRQSGLFGMRGGGTSLRSDDIIDHETGGMFFQSPGTTPVVGVLYGFELPLFRELHEL
ncbi:membrane-associated protein, putative [Bodo saltans]|uniref:Membrane-associated protein, putative n=1 Tax=Bodo saltans TaxID=75058 RepID=A0A0S4J376_BODSA|nr:membrane-associated protein, putative [Bodo saltans]|eukprot:CUG74385.1 membrane-associated protein, putative [Bodo saltans]